MTVIRFYDKELQATTGAEPVIAAAARNGPICYLGQGKYAGGSAFGIQILDVTISGGASLDTLLVGLTGINGTGQVKDLESNRAGKIICVIAQNVNVPPVTRRTLLRCYDEATGTLDWEYLVGDSADDGSITFTGTHWFLSWRSTLLGTPERFLTLEISGSSVTVLRDLNLALASPAAVMFNAMTFDGTHMWALNGGYLSRWEVDGRRPPTSQLPTPGAFLLNGSTLPLGVTTDWNNNIVVMSRT